MELLGMNTQDMKLRRAVARKRTIQINREEYLRHKAEKKERRQAVTLQAVFGNAESLRVVHPQGALRTAVRTRLAQGVVEAVEDLPVVCHAERGDGKSRKIRSPSISPLLKCSALKKRSGSLSSPSASPVLNFKNSPTPSMAECSTCDEFEFELEMLPAPAVPLDEQEADALPMITEEAMPVRVEYATALDKQHDVFVPTASEAMTLQDDEKVQRAAQRKRGIALDHAKYLRQKAKKQERREAGFPADRRGQRPQRALRSSLRSRLSTGLVEGVEDLPALLYVEPSSSCRRKAKKASVARLLKTSDAASRTLKACDYEAEATCCTVDDRAVSSSQSRLAWSYQRHFEEAEHVGDLIVQDGKLERAAKREKSIKLDRAKYLRQKAEKQQRREVQPSGWNHPDFPADLRGLRPQRALRSALRSRLASGLVESPEDLPVLSSSSVYGTRNSRTKKMEVPCVARLLKTSLTMPLQRTEPAADELSEEAVNGCDITPENLLPFSRARRVPVLLRRSVRPLPVATEESTPSSASSSRSIEVEAGAHDDAAMKAEKKAKVIQKAKRKAEKKLAKKMSAAKPIETEAEVEKPKTVEEDDKTSKRAEIMQNLVAKLRAEVLEADKARDEAKAKAEECARKVKETAEAQKKAKEQENAADLKKAREAEKKRTAELKKRRNQQMHVQALQEKAQRKLDEAEAAKERAKDEAVMKEAALKAKAECKHRELLQAELRRVSEQAESLKKGSAEEANLFRKTAQLEAEERRAQAQAEAEASVQTAQTHGKALLDRQMQEITAQLEAEKQAALEQAEADRAAKQAEAAAQAAAFAERAGEQLQALLKQEVAARKARQEVELAEKQAEEQRRAEEVEKREREAKENAKALREAKAIEQQRSQKYKKSMQQKRAQEAAKEGEKRRAEEEARAAKAALCAAALAREEQARKMLADAKLTAEREALAIKEAAQKEAEAIRAAALLHLELEREELERERAALEEDSEDELSDMEIVAESSYKANVIDDEEAEEEEEENWHVVDSSDDEEEKDWDIVA